MGLGQQLALEADLEAQAHEQARAVLEPAGELGRPELATQDPARRGPDSRLRVDLLAVFEHELVGTAAELGPRTPSSGTATDRLEHVCPGDLGEHQAFRLRLGFGFSGPYMYTSRSTSVSSFQ
jgi:hypothetical protein